LQDRHCTGALRGGGVRERRPLRILHVTPYSADAWAYGGIPRLTDCLARGLARRGHQVTWCTTDACDEATRLPPGRSAGARFGPWPERTTADGVAIRVFPNFSNRLAYHLQLFLPLGLDQFMRRHAGDFDVAHLHACRNVPGVIAARHLHRIGVPYVLAPNGTAPLIERHRTAKRVFDAVAGRRTLGRAARVLAVTEAERLDLQRLGVDPSVIRVIPNPVDLEEFTPPVTRGRFRERCALPPGPIVLFLGKLTPRKGLDILARACTRLRRDNLSLVIAGNDMGAGADTRAIIRQLGLVGRTVFTGLLRGRERLEALADADVLVYPSQHEIFGLVPIEAILSGTPVVVADDSGCGEIVRETGGGQIVRHGDDEALARAIEDVLADPVRWRAAAIDGARRVKAAYGADVVSARIERMYVEMTEARWKA
jgi:glycosyltransferase involved in cell wall biosynthesis